MKELSVNCEIYDCDRNCYVIGDKINEGGFGFVHQAIRKDTNEIFAIKLLPSNADYEQIKSFEYEMKNAQKLNSEYVVKYIHLNMEKPYYILMEYAEEGTLKDLLLQKTQINCRFSITELLSIFINLVSGMVDLNIVHRDIKPSNILKFSNGFKISDFGISKFIDENSRTWTFKYYGTNMYKAPEVWLKKDNTMQSDIYSMGIVFYQLATLNYPYNVKTLDVISLQEAHCNDSIVPPEVYNNNLDVFILNMIHKMLYKDLGRRYKNWNELLTHLKNNIKKKDNTSSTAKKMTETIYERNKGEINKENEEKKKIKEKEDFEKRIDFVFKNMIIEPLNKTFGEVNDILGTCDIGFEGIRNSINDNQIAIRHYEIKYKSNTIFTFVWCPIYTPVNSIIINRNTNEKVIAIGRIYNRSEKGYVFLLTTDNNDFYGKLQTVNILNRLNTNEKNLTIELGEFRDMLMSNGMNSSKYVYEKSEFNVDIISNMINQTIFFKGNFPF